MKRNEPFERMIRDILPRSFNPEEADEDREAWKKRIRTIVERRTPVDKQLRENIRELQENPERVWRRK